MFSYNPAIVFIFVMVPLVFYLNLPVSTSQLRQRILLVLFVVSTKSNHITFMK